MVCGRVDTTHQDVPIQVDPLILLDVKPNWLKVWLLKDGGCSTNAVSKRLVKSICITVLCYPDVRGLCGV